jgi:hypothetical protein
MGALRCREAMGDKYANEYPDDRRLTHVNTSKGGLFVCLFYGRVDII